MELDHWEEELLEVAGRKLERGEISRRDFMRLVGALGLAAAVPGALAGRAHAAEAELAQAGNVRFLIAENFWANWEPYQNTAQSQFRINEQIYDHLVEFPTGDIGKPRPMLATSWRRLDARTWEFKLRRGVTFHNGQPFTSRDVKASIELASGATKKKTVDAGLFWVPTTVQRIDDHTVRLKTRQPFGALFSALQHSHIVAAADLEGAAARLKKQPNGTGPFRLVKDEPNKKTMVRNDKYWRRPAQIRGLVWEFVQDPQTRLNALLAGQAHAIDRVPPEHLAIIRRNSKLALASRTGIEMVNLWVRPGRSQVWQENANFRRAVNWSIDRDALVKGLVQGNARAARSVIPSGTLYWRPQSPVYDFNPTRAKSELEAGNLANGGPEFELWVAKGFLPRAVEVVESIVNSMQKVGLKPKVRTSDVAGVIDDIFSKTGTGLMYHLSWSSNGDPMTAFQVYSPAFAWFWGDETIAKLIDDGLKATSPAKRKRVYATLQAHMWRQNWHVPLYYSDFTVAHSKRLTGLRVTQNFSTYFYPARLA
jgi:peptide/nickel transport system substrate-binding protein